MGILINLGSGSLPLDGFVNVDALPEAPGVDVVADIAERLPFADGEADLIYAAHVLEHFPTARVPELLADWRRVLRDGGLLLLAVPNLETIARILLEVRPDWFTPPHGPWVGALYGGQKDEYDFHKTGFTPSSLAALLSDAGFGEAHLVNRFREIAEHDASYSPLPFGINISLNMRAVAGGRRLPPPLFRRTALEQLFDVVDYALQAGMVASTRARSRLMAPRRRQLEQRLREP